MDNNIVRKKLSSAKLAKSAIAALSAAAGVLAAEATFSPAQAAQQFTCRGRMDNGWNYTASFVDGRFTQIRWERSGQPPQTSQLTFSSTNSSGQPIYRGSFLGATSVTLVDLSGGNVRNGSQISVGVEEWGWSRGNCGTSTGSGNTSGVPVSTVQRSIVGLPSDNARSWLRTNNFSFVQTVSQTNTAAVERWIQPRGPAIHVTFSGGRVSSVIAAP